MVIKNRMNKPKGINFLKRLKKKRVLASVRTKRLWKNPKGELNIKREKLKGETPSMVRPDLKAIRRRQEMEVDEEVRYQVFIKKSGIAELPFKVQNKYIHEIKQIFWKGEKIKNNAFNKKTLKKEKEQYKEWLGWLKEEAKKM